MTLPPTYQKDESTYDKDLMVDLDEDGGLDPLELEKLSELILELIKKEIRLDNEREGRHL
jgi:hypothetical protein